MGQEQTGSSTTLLGYVSYVVFSGAASVAVAQATKRVHEIYGMSWLVAYLISINAVAFGFYAYDKTISKLPESLHLRVPEKVLIWLLAFPGGTVGSISAMFIRRHKTAEKTLKFRLELLQALKLQFLLLVILLYLTVVRGQVSREDLDQGIQLVVNVVLTLAQKVFDWFTASGMWEQLQDLLATLGVR